MKDSNVKNRIMELFFDFPNRRFHKREIARLVGSSAPAVSTALKSLEKEDIVSIKRGFMHETTANRTEKFRTKKKISNLNRLYDSGFLDYLKEEMPLTTIVLFGSYAKGEDIEKSDIDIAILGKEKKLNIQKYSEKLKRHIHLGFINMKKISRELKNNILNGIILSGGFEDEL